MKHLRLFEEYNNKEENWYEEIDYDTYLEYLDEGEFSDLTPADIGRIIVPSGFKFELYTDRMSNVQYISISLVDKQKKFFWERESFEINKFQDDWFIVKYVGTTEVLCFKCDTYEGVNKLIMDIRKK